MKTYKKLLVCEGKRQVWFLSRNGAIGWDGACSQVQVGRLYVWESRGKRNEIRLEIAKWRNRCNSCRGYPRLMADNDRNETEGGGTKCSPEVK